MHAGGICKSGPVRAPNKTSREPAHNERTTVFWGALAEGAHAEEKNHRGTEGTEKGGDLCLRASVPLWFCGSVVLWFNRLDRNVVLLGPPSLPEQFKQLFYTGLIVEPLSQLLGSYRVRSLFLRLCKSYVLPSVSVF